MCCGVGCVDASYRPQAQVMWWCSDRSHKRVWFESSIKAASSIYLCHQSTRSQAATSNGCCVFGFINKYIYYSMAYIRYTHTHTHKYLSNNNTLYKKEHEIAMPEPEESAQRIHAVRSKIYSPMTLPQVLFRNIKRIYTHKHTILSSHIHTYNCAHSLHFISPPPHCRKCGWQAHPRHDIIVCWESREQQNPKPHQVPRRSWDMLLDRITSPEPMFARYIYMTVVVVSALF